MYISSASDAIMQGYNGIALNYTGSSMVAHQTAEIAISVFESVISSLTMKKKSRLPVKVHCVIL